MNNKLLLSLVLLAVFPRLCMADADFFGKWTPPKSLTEFWKPLDNSWWNPDDNSRLADYCKRFASNSKPEHLIKDIVADLKAHPSVERTFVYSMLIVNWDSRATLKLL